jgi:ElaA protein
MTGVRWSRFDDMPRRALYGALRLRIAVFGVEQWCVYQDLDGKDPEPTTWHGWIEDGGEVVSYVRILGEPGAQWITRVVTAPHARDRGLARLLVTEALQRSARPVRINAQSYLLGWYAAFGFEPDGAEFLEDGIPHTPMVVR